MLIIDAIKNVTPNIEIYWTEAKLGIWSDSKPNL